MVHSWYPANHEIRQSRALGKTQYVNCGQDHSNMKSMQQKSCELRGPGVPTCVSVLACVETVSSGGWSLAEAMAYNPQMAEIPGKASTNYLTI